VLTGTYQSQVFGRVEVSVQGSGLQARFVDKGTTTPLVPDASYGYDNHTFDWTDPYEGKVEAPVTFWVEGSQPAQYMVSPYGVGARQ
jgi:hypothetical protein